MSVSHKVGPTIPAQKCMEGKRRKGQATVMSGAGGRIQAVYW